MDIKLKNEVQEKFKNHEIIFGDNWYIVKPNKEEIEKYRKSLNQCKYTSEKECLRCKTIFDYGRSNLKFCRCCKLYIE